MKQVQKRIRYGVAVLSLALLAPSATASAADDVRAVLDTVQGLFDAMATRDADAARAVLLPEGRLIVVARGDDGALTTRPWDHTDFAAGLEGEGPVLLERVWDPEVRIEGDLAAYRAAYDFHRDGAYSHCGVDLFQLVRLADGWRISGGSFTRETTPCADNPLPPPGT